MVGAISAKHLFLYNMEKVSIEKALEELRKDENKRKFIQTVDLIVNLRDFDVRKESVNVFIAVPNPTEKKIAGFLTRKSGLVDSITKDDFKKFSDAKEMKRLARKYDFFIAAAPLMGEIATTFGRVLGPVGKMPSPQGGIMPIDSDDKIKETVEKMKMMIRIRTKERSIKMPIGKEDMPDEKLKQNVEAVLNELEKVLPKGKQNIKDVLIKLTMTKPVRVR